MLKLSMKEKVVYGLVCRRSGLCCPLTAWAEGSCVPFDDGLVDLRIDFEWLGDEIL